MKAKLKYGLGGYCGKVDDMVFYQERHSDKLLARRYTKPRYSTQNKQMGESSKKIFGLQPSEEFKNDLKNYLLWYKASKIEPKKPLRSWANVFLLMMFNLAKAYPEIDLRTLCREDIIHLDLPCCSVKRAVEAGLLPEVHNWEKMEAVL